MAYTELELERAYRATALSSIGVSYSRACEVPEYAALVKARAASIRQRLLQEAQRAERRRAGRFIEATQGE